MRPRVLGSLFTPLSGVLHVLPDIHLDSMPRIADFAMILAAVDEIAPEMQALASYGAMARQVNVALVEGDPIANAVSAMVRSCPGGH